MIKLVRAAVLSEYVEVARNAGLDPYEMVKSVGLSPSCLIEPDMKISTAKARRLLEDSAVLTGVENFGLRMAEKRRLSALGPLGMLTRDAPTIRGALDIMRQNIHLHNESVQLRVEEAEGKATIRLDLVVGDRGLVHQSIDLAMGTMMRVLRIFFSTDWMPSQVNFMHPRPSDVTLHTKIFGPSLEFSSEFDGILCDSNDLDTPIAASDPVMAAYARKQMEQSATVANSSIEREIRQLVLILLPSGRCSVDNVARHLNMDRRTVHRQLMRVGLTFSDLVDRVRQELSERYLGLNSRTLAEISSLLGFSVPGAYSRWHQKHYGMSPSAKRERLKSGDH